MWHERFLHTRSFLPLFLASRRTISHTSIRQTTHSLLRSSLSPWAPSPPTPCSCSELCTQHRGQHLSSSRSSKHQPRRHSQLFIKKSSETLCDYHGVWIKCMFEQLDRICNVVAYLVVELLSIVRSWQLPHPRA
jgi:hypothetical protein